VEAISVDPPGTRAPAWIGINQNAANRFVEQALTHHMLPTMITAGTLRREQVLGHARLDFLINDTTYIEVKTPLDNLQVTLGSHVQTRPRPPLDSTDRLVRHIGELGDKPRCPPARDPADLLPVRQPRLPGPTKPTPRHRQGPSQPGDPARRRNLASQLPP
jgi:hypothetical protein